MAQHKKTARIALLAMCLAAGALVTSVSFSDMALSASKAKIVKKKKSVAPAEIVQASAPGVGSFIVKRNYKAAFAQLSAQANTGDVNAQYRLAVFYRLGLGTKQNGEAARHWLEQSAAAGNVKAATLLKQLDFVVPATVKKSSDGAGPTALQMAGEISYGKLPARAAGQADWLTLAAARKNVAAITALSSVQSSSTGTTAALATAVKLGDLPTISALVKGGAVPGADERGRSPLMIAVNSGNLELVQAVLHGKPDLLALDKSGNSAIDWAALSCRPDIMAKLSEAGAEIGGKGQKNHPLVLIAQNCGNWPDFKRFFAAPDMATVDQLGRNAAWYAAAKGDVSLLAWLSDSGVNLNLPDKSGLTPLHSAAVSKQSFAIRYIASKVDKTDQGSVNGTTPMMLAAYVGCVECLPPLLERGGDIDAKNLAGDTVLMFAVRGQQQQLVSLLLKQGANAAARNKGGDTPGKVAGRLGAIVMN
jgi:uncharacterized protein